MTGPVRWASATRVGVSLLTVVGLLALSGCLADPPPGIGTAVAGSREATISWTAPLGDTGSTVSAYRVTPYIGSAAQPSTVFASPATTQTVTGLTSGAEYTFVISAIQPNGNDSARSAPSNSVTPFGPNDVEVGSCGPINPYGYNTSASGTQHIAEVFTSAAAGSLKSVTLALSAPNDPPTAPLTVEFAEHLGAGAFTVLASTEVDPTDLSTDSSIPTVVDVPFEAGVAVTLGQQYGVLLSTSSADHAEYRVHAADTDPNQPFAQGCADDRAFVRFGTTGPFTPTSVFGYTDDLFFDVRVR